MKITNYCTRNKKTGNDTRTKQQEHGGKNELFITVDFIR